MTTALAATSTTSTTSTLDPEVKKYIDHLVAHAVEAQRKQLWKNFKVRFAAHTMNVKLELRKELLEELKTPPKQPRHEQSTSTVEEVEDPQALTEIKSDKPTTSEDDDPDVDAPVTESDEEPSENPTTTAPPREKTPSTSEKPPPETVEEEETKTDEQEEKTKKRKSKDQEPNKAKKAKEPKASSQSLRVLTALALNTSSRVDALETRVDNIDGVQHPPVPEGTIMPHESRVRGVCAMIGCKAKVASNGTKCKEHTATIRLHDSKVLRAKNKLDDEMWLIATDTKWATKIDNGEKKGKWLPKGQKRSCVGCWTAISHTGSQMVNSVVRLAEPIAFEQARDKHDQKELDELKDEGFDLEHYEFFEFKEQYKLKTPIEIKEGQPGPVRIKDKTIREDLWEAMRNGERTVF